MPAVIRVPAVFSHVKGLRLRWFPLVAALLAGAALLMDLAQRDPARSVPAAPAERQAAPPAQRSAPAAPLNQTPYIPPIRIGSSEAPPNPGAFRAARDSATLRRDGESS